MSTIVVVRKGNRAAIASDSLFSKGSIKISASHQVNHHKIHRFKDACIGFTGWSVFHTVFEAVIERYPSDLDFRSRRHIFETFQKLHRRLKEDFHLLTGEEQNDNDQPVESSQWDCLIAAPSGIFAVSSFRHVEEYATFWAQGSGTRFALGAMHAVYHRHEDPEVIAQAGIEAACEFDDGSGVPLQSFNLSLATKAATEKRSRRRSGR